MRLFGFEKDQISQFLIFSQASEARLRFTDAPDDVAFSRDYDGDSKTDFAIYRPTTGEWFIQTSYFGTIQAAWGAPGDVPVPGRYWNFCFVVVPWSALIRHEKMPSYKQFAETLHWHWWSFFELLTSAVITHFGQASLPKN